jgi:chromosome segregation ATPase
MEQDLLSELGDLAQKYHQAQGTIVKLQQRVETQEYELQEQTTRIQHLEQTLAQAQSQLARVSQLDGQMDYFKEEILQLVEERYGGQQQPTAPQPGGSLLNQQLDNHTQTLKELRRDLDKMSRYDDQISLTRTESIRLNKEVHQLQADLEKLERELDERVRPLSYIEEQRRATSRTVTELQAEVPELHKKIDSWSTKMQVIEQKVPQFAKYEAALDSLREEIRRHREHIDFQAAERERQLKNWTDLAQTTEQRMRENEAMLEKYAEHYQLNKRALTSLQDFQEQLQREQHRFSELQRLSEERQRAELEKFQADHEHRWQKQNMELQPRLGDFNKTMETVQQRLDELTKLNQTLEDQMNIVLQIIEEDIEARASALSDWQARFESLANGQA